MSMLSTLFEIGGDLFYSEGDEACLAPTFMRRPILGLDVAGTITFARLPFAIMGGDATVYSAKKMIVENVSPNCLTEESLNSILGGTSTLSWHHTQRREPPPHDLFQGFDHMVPVRGNDNVRTRFFGETPWLSLLR